MYDRMNLFGLKSAVHKVHFLKIKLLFSFHGRMREKSC